MFLSVFAVIACHFAAFAQKCPHSGTIKYIYILFYSTLMSQFIILCCKAELQIREEISMNHQFESKTDF